VKINPKSEYLNLFHFYDCLDSYAFILRIYLSLLVSYGYTIINNQITNYKQITNHNNQKKESFNVFNLEFGIFSRGIF
jgi:hypothetical protein